MAKWIIYRKATMSDVVAPPAEPTPDPAPEPEPAEPTPGFTPVPAEPGSGSDLPNFPSPPPRD